MRPAKLHIAVILPGDFAEMSIPKEATPDTTWALEPRLDSPANHNVKLSAAWPTPQEVTSVGHSIRVQNNGDAPIIFENICQNRHVSDDIPSVDYTPAPDHNSLPKQTPNGFYSDLISLDPDSILPDSVRNEFKDLHHRFDAVFDPHISKYNGDSGKMEAHVNMGPVLPPQHKGRLPSYDRDRLMQLQEKFDELEKAVVFSKPEDVGITVEYLNLPFLVAKPNGGSRQVTSFGEVALCHSF